MNYPIWKEIPVYIIHLERSKDREKYIERIKQQFSKVTIVEGIDYETMEDKEYWLDLKNFTRMPSLKPQNLLARVGCFKSHRKAYEKILEDKVESAIILEDDAYLDAEHILEQEVRREEIVVLGHKTIQKPPYKKIGTWAIYYRKEIIPEILEQMKKKKWKAFDLWLNENVYKHIPTCFCYWFKDGSNEGQIESLISKGMGKKYLNNCQ